MKIGIVTPIPGAVGVDSSGDILRLKAKARPGTEVTVVYVQGGKPTIEGAYDDALAVPGVLRTAIELERAGMDALVMNCTADTGVAAMKECVSIPVVAPMAASMYWAAQLAQRFSVITFMERTRLRFYETARSLGLSDRFASVELIDTSCEEDIETSNAVVEAIFDAGIRSMEKHDAHALIMGCTALEMAAGRVRERFKKADIPLIVLEPYSIALHMAEDMVDMGLTHSKLSFPNPREL